MGEGVAERTNSTEEHECGDDDRMGEEASLFTFLLGLSAMSSALRLVPLMASFEGLMVCSMLLD